MSSQAIRKRRVTQKLTYTYPVVTVTRSNKNVLAQVNSPETRKVVFTTTSFKLTGMTKSEKSKIVGQEVANWLKQNDMQQVVFNRNGYLYHGRIKAIADSIRESGIVI